MNRQLLEFLCQVAMVLGYAGGAAVVICWLLELGWWSR